MLYFLEHMMTIKTQKSIILSDKIWNIKYKNKQRNSSIDCQKILLIIEIEILLFISTKREKIFFTVTS